MNEDKKKKIYLGIIGLCVLVSAIVFFSFQSGSSTPPEETSLNIDVTEPVTSTGAAPIAGSTTFIVPSVFPQDKTFKKAVLDNAKFKTLNSYNPLTISPEEVNRDDPFLSY